MNEQHIHAAIGEISEELIDPVAKLRQKKRYPVAKWVAAAACLCLLVSLPLIGFGNGIKAESTGSVLEPEIGMENQYGGLMDRVDAGTAEKPAQTAIFRAKVLEVDEKCVLVEPMEGEPELLSSNRIYVSFGKLENIPQIRVGDILEIHYDGMIAETYPAQIDGVFSVAVIE